MGLYPLLKDAFGPLGLYDRNETPNGGTDE